MIVADANIVACLFINSDQSELAEAALKRDPVWAAPVLWRSEFRNTLASCLMFGRLNFEAAMLAVINAEATMSGHEYAVSSTRVLDLAARFRCPARDCEYVALAEELEVPLVTTDETLLKAFPGRTVSLKTFAASQA